MYPILLADDERTIREKLPLAIPFSDYGFEVAGVASNGLEAWQLLSKLRPALILLDIRMPVMDGLQFLERLRQSEFRDTPVIILSGYSEFSYAQQAIRLGAKGYLTKPVDEEEAGRLLISVREELLARERDLRLERYRLTLAELRKIAEDNAGIEKTPEYALLHVALCRLLDSDGERHPSQQISFTVAQAAGLGADCFMKKQNGLYTYLLPLSSVRAQGGVKPFLQALQHQLALSGLSCACFYDEMTLAEPKAPFQAQMDETLQAMAGQYFYHGTTLIDASEWAFARPCPEPKFDLPLEALRDAMLLMDEGKVLAAFEEIKAELYQQEPTPGEARRFFDRCDAMLEELMLRHSGDAQTAFAAHPLRSLDSSLYPDSAEWCALLWQRLCDTLDHLRERTRLSSMGVSHELVAYVQRRYATAISLQEVAEQFHMNAAYLGRIFQKAAGQSFRQYINYLRINQAKLLLRSTDLMIYEIAEKVGFSDSAYFVSKFSSETGLTPVEFRNG